MERLIFALCGIWVWMTRGRRTAAYLTAASTLEQAHAHLLEDFGSRASTAARGELLPWQRAALSILEDHATVTYQAVSQMSDLRRCCRFVAEELRLRTDAPAAAPIRAVRAKARPRTVIRIRYRLPRLASVFAPWRGSLNAESTAAWPAKVPETETPLKAA